MGVPGFFLWLLKKYKKNNFIFDKSTLKDQKLLSQVNNLDYILIDANCLIHPVCFQVIKDNPNLNNIDKLQKKMYNEVILYIEKIISFVNPKIGVYLAVDGVAPIAKMKQQRSRRFKSVYDNNLWNNIKKKHNKEIPMFWNNSCISPGTKFMDDLHNKLKIWGEQYSSDHNLKVIYSSCNSPAEGEHKLLQFIRDNLKNKIDYTYITYGLDADLIFLMLATGIKDTFLLREANNLNKKNKSDELQFVSMNIMRESIIKSVKRLIDLDESIVINEDNLINDFIFICYLLGNDFLPHIPSLDIYNNGIDYLLKIYVDILENNDFNYLINKNSDEKINQEFFNKFIYKISLDEEAILKKNYASKKRRFKCQSTDLYDIEMHKIENLQFRIEDPVQLGKDSMEEWRNRYYKHYYELEPEEIDDFSKEMVKHFLNGLKWVTEYYFDKCPAWRWYYPYDIPPFITDIHNFKINFKEFNFKLEEPLSQFEQLLCVLPPQSSYLLPLSLRKIMLNNNSSVRYLYPTSFELDFLNKKKYWMTIPKLPDLDITSIQKIFKKYSYKITDFDKKLNSKQKVYIYLKKSD